MAANTYDEPKDSVAKSAKEIDDATKPYRRLYDVAKWVVGIALALTVAFSAVRGVIQNTATHKDLDARTTPLEARVGHIEEELIAVNAGVKILVDAHEDNKLIIRKRRMLEMHDREYQQALQEYTADSSAGKPPGPRPRKSPQHLALEFEVKFLEGGI